MSDTEKTIELLPCPFCGGEAIMLERKCDEARYAIGCSNIECIVWLPKDARKRELQNYAMCWVNKSNAIKAWNRRADDGEEYKKIWGTIYGNNLKIRGFYQGMKGVPDGEPWVTTIRGQHWSCHDVRFVPDTLEEQANGEDR